MKRITLVLAVTLVTATAALAHSKAEDTTPADGTTVETVAVIELRFDDPMRVTAITVSGPDGDLNITRETGFDPVTEFHARPPEVVPAGAYTVDWRGLSADGHPMQGTFGFTVED